MHSTIIKASLRRIRLPPPGGHHHHHHRRHHHQSMSTIATSSSTTPAPATEPMSSPQAESNTWCKPADPDMEKWAGPIVQDVLELYHLRVDDPKIYAHYHPEAVFDDPAGTLRGRNAIRVAMEALPKVFSHGEPKEVQISYHPPLIGGERNRFDSTASGREQIGPQARISLIQTYQWRQDLLPGGISPGIFFGNSKEGVSLPTIVLLTFNADTHTISKHEDLWWGQKTQSDRPLVGSLHGLIKWANGRAWEAWGQKRYGDGGGPGGAGGEGR